MTPSELYEIHKDNISTPNSTTPNEKRTSRLFDHYNSLNQNMKDYENIVPYIDILDKGFRRSYDYGIDLSPEKFSPMLRLGIINECQKVANDPAVALSESVSMVVKIQLESGGIFYWPIRSYNGTGNGNVILLVGGPHQLELNQAFIQKIFLIRSSNLLSLKNRVKREVGLETTYVRIKTISNLIKGGTHELERLA